MYKIFSAPLQGFTTAPWRHYHAETYGAADGYFSPFLRVEKDEVRRHDLRDITSELNKNHPLVPQIIFRDIAEFELLLNTITTNGYNAVNLNMGCPFPPQVKHGRGSAVIQNLELLRDIKVAINSHPEITFSAKMRLGVDDAEQWKPALDVLNTMTLEHITVHPRTASQQYGGELQVDQFAEFLSRTNHKVIFNGDIAIPRDIQEVINRFPSISGVMIGRGLLARPSLIQEFRTGEIWSEEQQVKSLLMLHKSLFSHYSAVACGESQLMSQIKPFWEYLEPVIGHKTFKLIRKATTVSKYNAAISTIQL